MRALLKLLVVLTAVIAAAWFFLKDDRAFGQRMVNWAESTASHIETLLAEQDSEAGETTDTGVPFGDPLQPDWLENRSDEPFNDSDGASVTSGYTVTSEPRASEYGETDGRRDAFEGAALSGTFSEHLTWVKQVTRQYAPLSWELLMLYDDLPRNMEAETVDGMTMSSQKPMDSFMFLDGGSATEILGSMATNVHETAHSYFGNNIFRYAGDKRLALDWDNVNGFLYLSPSEAWFISFPKEMLFPSREIVNEIPRELRTFRFDTYVDGTTSTQGQGVIGLLDEFHAYYHGARCSFDLFRAYAEAEGSEVNGLLEWISETQSHMTAYFEFDFFIKEYLLQMRNNYPEEYEALRQCTSFTQAYRGVRREYSDLVRSYEQRINQKMAELNAAGEAVVEIKEGHLWVSSAGSMRSRGASLFHEDRATLEPVLRSGRYDKIESDFL